MTPCNPKKPIMGRVHSTESFAAADGPGVRFSLFLQGCPFRCKYCHNPDTQALVGGEEMTPEAALAKALRYRPYWGEEGGITVSGGEPLMQLEFVTELFRLAKAQGVNTALDTAGGCFTLEKGYLADLDRLMEHTDLVILDLKEANPQRHKALTGADPTAPMSMAQYLSDRGKPMWLRHVLVPGYTDFDEDLELLGRFIAGLKTVKNVEVLPYHSLGEFKWASLGREYELKGVSPPVESRIKNAEVLIGAGKRP